MGDILPGLSDWQSAFSRLDRTLQNARLVKEAHDLVRDILNGCISTLGRGAGGGAVPRVTPPVRGGNMDEVLRILRGLLGNAWLNVDEPPDVTGRIVLLTNALKDYAAFDDEGRAGARRDFLRIKDLLDEIAGRDVAVICGTHYPRDEVEMSIRELGIRFPVVLDPDNALIGPDEQLEALRSGRPTGRLRKADRVRDE